MKSIWNKELFKKNTELFKKRFPPLFQIYEPLVEEILALDFETAEVGNTDADNATTSAKGDATVKPVSRAPDTFFSFWKTSISPKGFPCAEENGLKLHSAYNPQKEAEGQLSSVNEKTEAIVFEGIGLGFAVIEAARKCTNALSPDIVIAESSPLHFFAALCVLDWESAFTYPNLVIALTQEAEQTIKLVNRHSIKNTVFVSVPAWKKHDEPFFSIFEELIKRNKRKEEINDATTKRFGALWNRNCLKNSKIAVLSEDPKIYKSRAQSLPFLLIAAGPSLKDLLPSIKEASKKCVTVAVDTALRVLVKNGYQPDFVLLTDPQYYAYRHIAGVHSPTSVLVTTQEAYPSVFRMNFRKIVCAKSQMPIGNFFEKYCGERTDLGSGGSVASCAWNFCQLCGAKKIYLSGLDLSFPEKQTHIKGSTFEQKAHSSSMKTSSAETKSMPSYFSGNLVEGKNYLGERVMTDSRMKMFAWWFESRFSECSDVQNLSLGGKGLCIPGVKVSSLQELLNEKDITAEKEDFFKQSERTAHEERTTRGKKDDDTSDLEEKYSAAKKELERRLAGIPLSDFYSVQKALFS